MSAKVAVLGPQDLVERICKDGKQYKMLEMVPFAYKNEAEVLSIIDRIETKVDILLFSGPIPYYAARESVDVDLPMLYVSYSGSALYKALFCYFEEKHRDSHTKLRISIDTLHKHIIEEIFQELHITDYELYAKSYDSNSSHDEFVAFHRDLYQQGKTDVAFTCLTSAYSGLNDLKVPVFRIVPTTSSIREGLQFAATEARNLVSKEAQLCVGVVRILDRQKLDSYLPSAYEQKRIELIFEELFVNFCEEIKASMKEDNSNGEYIFYATRGAIERATGYYRYMPLIRDIDEHLTVKVGIGLGYGYTGNEAEKNSREALKHAVHTNKSACFAIFQDGKIRGPLESGRVIEFYSKSEESKLIDLARKSNVSIMTLNKITGILASGKQHITANDIAESLNITLRSSRRILSSLEKSGIAVVVGVQQPSTRGRPRQIYKINIE